MRFKAMLPLLLCIAGAACDDDDDDNGPITRVEATGFWVGIVDGIETEDDRRIELLLREEEDGEIEGSGNIRSRSGSIAVVVEGTNVFPDISLTLITDRFGDGKQFINFQGEFIGDDVMRGKLNGGGFNNEPLRLRRTEQIVDP